MVASSESDPGQGVAVLVHAQVAGERFAVWVGTLSDAEGRAFTLRWEASEAPAWLRYAGRTAERYRHEDAEAVEVADVGSLALSELGRALYAVSPAGWQYSTARWTTVPSSSLRCGRSSWTTSRATRATRTCSGTRRVTGCSPSTAAPCEPTSLRMPIPKGSLHRKTFRSSAMRRAPVANTTSFRIRPGRSSTWWRAGRRPNANRSHLRAPKPTLDGASRSRRTRSTTAVAGSSRGQGSRAREKNATAQLPHVQTRIDYGIDDAVADDGEHVYGVGYGRLVVLEREASGALADIEALALPNAEQGIAVTQGRVFTWGGGGTAVVDVGDPARPVLLDTFAELPRAAFLERPAVLLRRRARR